MVISLAVGYLIFISVMAWVWNCNRRTYRQRIRLIGLVSEANRKSGFAKDYFPAFDSITYERHLFLLATFRNPIEFYVGLPGIAA